MDRFAIGRDQIGPLPECLLEIFEHLRARIEQIDTAAKTIAREESAACERRGTKCEWARPVPQPARPGALRRRLKNVGVILRARHFTQGHSQRAAYNISCHSGWKLNFTPRRQMKAALVQTKGHLSISRILVASSSVEKGFCRKCASLSAWASP